MRPSGLIGLRFDRRLASIGLGLSRSRVTCVLMKSARLEAALSLVDEAEEAVDGLDARAGGDMLWLGSIHEYDGTGTSASSSVGAGV